MLQGKDYHVQMVVTTYLISQYSYTYTYRSVHTWLPAFTYQEPISAASWRLWAPVHTHIHTCWASARILQSCRAHLQLSLVMKESALPVCLQGAHNTWYIRTGSTEYTAILCLVLTLPCQSSQHDVHNLQYGLGSHSSQHDYRNMEFVQYMRYRS